MSKIIVSLYGGLGNQLFQYATGYALSKQLNCELVLDLAWFDIVRNIRDTTPRKFSLSPFGLEVKQQKLGLDLKKKHQRIIDNILSLLRLRTPDEDEKIHIFRETTTKYDPTLFKNKAPLWLAGYWQSPRYFETWSSELRNKIGIPRDLNKENQKMLKQIENSESVCIHIRRGDYVSNKQANEFHGLCSMEYYRKGLQSVKSNFKNPHCFVFTDDPAWAKDHFDLGTDFTVVDTNGPDEAHCDLWLMAACKKFVIANSSLSWWGAWLGQFKEKKVVAPFEWFKNNPDLASDLIPQDWIKL